MTAPLEMTLPSTPADVMRGCTALNAFCVENGVPVDVTQDVVLAFEEIGSNVVRHGYGSDPSHSFLLHAQRGPGELQVVVIDEAALFDPTTFPAPGPVADPDARPGGLGILIVRHLVDDLAYERVNGHNRLVMTRRLNGHG